MTPDTNQPNDANETNSASELQNPAPEKASLCEPCSGIQRNWRRAPGHAELVQGGNRQEDQRQNRYSNARQSLVTITSYRCDRCGAAWEYENNKANQKAGWSVVARKAG